MKHPSRLIFAFLFLLCLTAPAAFSQSQVLSCTVSSVPPLVRGEGITERIGDIGRTELGPLIISCGG